MPERERGRRWPGRVAALLSLAGEGAQDNRIRTGRQDRQDPAGHERLHIVSHLLLLLWTISFINLVILGESLTFSVGGVTIFECHNNLYRIVMF